MSFLSRYPLGRPSGSSCAPSIATGSFSPLIQRTEDTCKAAREQVLPLGEDAHFKNKAVEESDWSEFCFESGFSVGKMESPLWILGSSWK